MKKFSERYGYKEEIDLQIDSINKKLQNKLWNILEYYYFNKENAHSNFSYREDFILNIKRVWFKFGFDLDILDQCPYPNPTNFLWRKIKKLFLDLKWFEKYDFIEFVINDYKDQNKNENFIELCNNILENERSAYRIVNKRIVPISDEIELEEVSEVFESGDKFQAVQHHIDKALDSLSNKKNPNYANVMKESITAVESMCKLIVGNPDTTLGRALYKLEDRNVIDLHKDFKKALKGLYGYASDYGGIRHDIKTEQLPETLNLTYEDSKFMLVTCSAFVNYLKIKIEKAGINIADL